MITIDGPSASGKSTLAKSLAQRLNIRYLDSGAFYRSIASFLIKDHKVDISPQDLKEFLESAEVKLEYDQEFPQYFFNGENVTSLLRNEQVAAIASKIAQYPVVRKFVNNSLRKVAQLYDCVADGRDLGSKVFPKAQIKFFLTASIISRAKRRELELRSRGINTDLNTVIEQLKSRDDQDTKRHIDPLVIPDEAIFLDTTDMSTGQVFNRMLKQIHQSLCKKPPLYRRAFWNLNRWLIRLFYSIRIYNTEALEQFLSGVVFANHLSYLDAPLLLALLGPNTVFIAHKKVMQRNLFFRLISKIFPMILVDQENMPRDFLSRCQVFLRQGQHLVIFPEGKRGDGTQLLAFQNGIATIVSHLKCKNLLPICIEGTEKIWPIGKDFPRLGGDILVKIGEPLTLEDSMMDTSRENIHRLKDYLSKKMILLTKN
jgi:cytidylate kinase